MNDNYVLSCCSTADLTRARFEARDIPYLCFHFNIGGKQYPDDLGETMSFDEFYSRIKDGAEPTTAQVNTHEFVEFFEGYLKEGRDVLHVSLSSGISGTYGAAVVAAGQLKEKYPDRRVEVVDSLAASSGFGLLMEMLADRRDAGATIDELKEYAEEIKLTIHHWFFSSDLTSFIRGGRISRTAGMMGTILHICPLLNVDAAGKLIPRYKVPSKKRVIKAIVDKMIEHAENGTDYSGRCYISHSACYEDARKVADLIEATFPKLAGPVEIYSVGTVIGSHTGCGTVALFFKGDKRTDIAEA